MLKKIALALIALITLLLLFALTRPDSFSVERRLHMQAPPEKVFALVSDFHHWPAWSPWEKLDPSMTRTHSGAASGVGAVYAWKGNDDVGAGRMEITAAQVPGQVDIKLDFLRPFESSNTTRFTLTPKDGGTEFVWTMQGPMPYISKLMSVFVSMDKMIGPDFEAGLKNLKAAAEKPG
jgi:uncharacterized protein YndB with AHSA1/START domain